MAVLILSAPSMYACTLESPMQPIRAHFLSFLQSCCSDKQDTLIIDTGCQSETPRNLVLSLVQKQKRDRTDIFSRVRNFDPNPDPRDLETPGAEHSARKNFDLVK